MPTTTPLELRAQRDRGLELANRVRTDNATAKRDLTAGRRSLTGIMEDPDHGSMRAGDLVAAMRGVGPVKAGCVLRRAGVSPRLELRKLTYRQQMAIVAELARYPTTRDRLRAIEPPGSLARCVIGA